MQLLYGINTAVGIFVTAIFSLLFIWLYFKFCVDIDTNLYSKNILGQSKQSFGLKIVALPNDKMNVLRNTCTILGDPTVIPKHVFRESQHNS